MTFILDTLEGDQETVANRFSAYYRYLEEVRDKLPENAYSFATAPWHYDPRDSKCPHDSWLEEMRIFEPAEGERQEVRRIKIVIRLLGSYHDGFIELSYPDVNKYIIETPESDFASAHGDWIIDEIRLSEHGRVIHEIIFHRGTRLLIESNDVIYRWISQKDN